MHCSPIDLDTTKSDSISDILTVKSHRPMSQRRRLFMFSDPDGFLVTYLIMERVTMWKQKVAGWPFSLEHTIFTLHFHLWIFPSTGLNFPHSTYTIWHDCYLSIGIHSYLFMLMNFRRTDFVCFLLYSYCLE